MQVDIIGAGIGGLTTAVALQQKGIESKVYEQAAELKPLGAGIILANNAMQVYEKLGLRTEIEGAGNRINSLNITTKELKRISNMDLKFFERKYGVYSVAIHRGKLQEILLSRFKGAVFLDHKLGNIIHDEQYLELHFENQPQQSSQILIGADGINSIVRNKYFKTGEIRDAKQICWRGIAEYKIPDQYADELNEAWGRGDRFGFVQLAVNKVYWYALKTQNADNVIDINGLSSYFSRYSDLVPRIISATPNNAIHTAKIEDLKPLEKWYQGLACLIGDAAHATTPNLGQGACQAIEDAYVISECLNNFEPIEAFKEFQKKRITKAHDIVNTSWRIGKVSHMTNPLAIMMRNSMMKLTPSSLGRKRSEKIFEI